MSNPQQHRLIGQVIADRYRVLELLAEGGMGAVYIAEHMTLHKQVALKIVHPEHAENKELALRFAREAMATSRIDHPNVISAMDYGTLPDGTAFLAVQLVRGPSLTRVLAGETKLHWARAATIGAQIADALAAAHSHGIVHRDLKPDNVLLQLRDDGGELVKVLDFGVAKFAPESKVPLVARTDVTQIGMVVGTPGYMAPEQTIGNPADERSDLYALGVILWEAMTGKTLWSAPDLQALVEKQLSETPPLLRAAGADPGVPDGLEQLVAALLARRAEDRPQDAAQVRDELHKYTRHELPEGPRWRTGARPVPEGRPPPSSAEVTLPLDRALDDDETLELSPSQLAERTQPTPVVMPRPTTISSGAPVRSLPARLGMRSSRAAWAVAALLAAILGAAVFLIATGRLELRPRREVAEVAERVARQLSPPPGETESANRGVPPARRDETSPASEPGPTSGETKPDRKSERAEPSGDEARTQVSEPKEKLSVARRWQLLLRAKTCWQKREQIDALGEMGDKRALPLLQRMYDRPRTGCGKKKREDCLGCVRASLQAAIQKLQGS